MTKRPTKPIKVTKPFDAITSISDKTGVSRRAISTQLGRSATFISTLAAQDDVYLSTLCAIARICDYKVLLVPNEEDGETLDLTGIPLKESRARRKKTE